MSLIEEALRKQREETEQQSEKKISLAPPPPPPEEPAPEPSEETTEPAQRSWGLLIGLSLAGLLAIIAIVWLLFFGLKLWKKDPSTSTILAAATSKVTNTTTAIKPVPAPVKPETPPTVKPVTAMVPVATNTLSVAPPVTAPQPVSTNPVAATSAVTQATAPAAIVAPVKMPMPVLWPRLTVSGVIGSSKNGHSAVIINGQMMSPGDLIEGVKILSIEKQRVKLSLQNEFRYVSVGSSTE